MSRGKVVRRPGCECDLRRRSSDRCNREWMRCNGALKAYSEDMRSRGLDNFGKPLKPTPSEPK